MIEISRTNEYANVNVTREKGPIMKRKNFRESVRTYKIVRGADRRGKNGGKNSKWQARKWEGTCPQPSSQSPAFSSIDNPRAAPLYPSIFPPLLARSLCCLFSRPCSTRHLTASSPLSNHSSRKTHSRNDGALSLSQLSVRRNFPRS